MSKRVISKQATCILGIFLFLEITYLCTKKKKKYIEIKTYNFVNNKKKLYKFTKCVPWKS